MLKLKLISILIIVFAILTACVPKRYLPTSNVCKLLDEKVSWYKSLKEVEKSSGVDMSLILAIIKQESDFIANARPYKKGFFGIEVAKTSSYGYSQAKAQTWDWYKSDTNRPSAKRDNFANSAHFISWYVNKTKQINGIDVNDYYNQYLAYHEGHGGFKAKSFNNKKWLKDIALKVANNAQKNKKLLSSCRENLDKNYVWF